MPEYNFDDDSVLEVEPMSKRRKGFPSEARVTTQGGSTSYGEEFFEKLGRSDLCPCGSNQLFKNCCMQKKNTPFQVGDDYER